MPSDASLKLGDQLARLHQHWQRRADAAPVQEATWAALLSLFDTGTASWPQLSVTLEEFADVAMRDDGLLELDPGYAADLVLATACAHHRPLAIEAFDREHGALFCVAIPARIRRDERLPEDFAVEIRQRILVGDGEPLIGRYRGRGALGGWVRVTIVRAAISAVRKGATEQRRQADLPDLLGLGRDDCPRAGSVRRGELRW